MSNELIVEVIEQNVIEVSFNQVVEIPMSGGNASTLNNQPATFYTNRANHTGQQTASTISDLTDAVNNNANVSASYAMRHSHLNFSVLNLIEVALTAGLKTQYDSAYNHSTLNGNPHSTNKSDIGLSNVDNTSDLNKPISTATQSALDAKADLVGGKIPNSQLPSFVDDVLVYANQAAFPSTGEDGKIYIATDSNLCYRWSGVTYVEISPSLALGDTSSTAYRGDRGKIAYDHSQLVGNPHNLTKADIGLSNVDNTSDLDKPISTIVQTALDLKVDKVLGKQLSTEDFTTSEKTKLSNIIVGRTSVNNSDYTATLNDRYIAQTGTLSSARTITLPPSYPVGERIVIGDESGSCTPWFSISVAPNTGQTINGQSSVRTLWSPYAFIELMYTGSGWLITSPAVGGISNQNMRDWFIYEEEFWSNLSNIQSGVFSQNTVGGSVSSLNLTAADDSIRKGAFGMRSGNSSGHYATLIAMANQMAYRQWERIMINWNASIHASPNVTTDYMAELGIMPSSVLNTQIQDGAIFQVSRADNANNILAVTADNSNRTKVDTGISFSPGTWRRFGIDYRVGVDCRFYIDGSLVATINTNIKGTSSTSFCHPMAKSIWIAGSNPQSWNIDRVRMIYKPADAYMRPVS